MTALVQVALMLSVMVAAPAVSLAQVSPTPTFDSTKHFRRGAWEQWIYWMTPGPSAQTSIANKLSVVNDVRTAAGSVVRVTHRWGGAHMKSLGFFSKQFHLMVSVVLLGGMALWLIRAGQDSALLKASPSRANGQPELVAAYGKLPMHFEANQGQTDSQVNFLARGSGYTLFLAPTEAVLALRQSVERNHPNEAVLQQKPTKPQGRETQTAAVRMKLVGANPAPAVSGQEELPGKVNYFLGNDPAKWRTNVATYAKVRYEEVYSGVDLVYYGNQQQLEYDFVVAPGADPNAIALEFEGADKLEVDAQGDLVLHLGDEQVRFQKPLVYQATDGTRREVAAGYSLGGARQVAFVVGAYDATKPLIIDPVLVYSTYLGGSGMDSAGDFFTGNPIAVDSAGNAYVTGRTSSTDFPTASPLQATMSSWSDVFIAKLNPSGSALLYSTYLGGNGSSWEWGSGIAVDSNGNAYVTGLTSSVDFPTTPSSFQPAFGAGSWIHAFVTKLNPAGSALVYSTYLGGSNYSDQGCDIAVDSSGNAYVAGTTNSVDFPTTPGSFQPALSLNDGGWGNDAFVTKLNPAGSALIYSTFIGGSSWDAIYGIAVDSSGNAYVAGETSSLDFPKVNDLGIDGDGYVDGVVAKLNPTGSALIYSTYLGGNGWDFAEGIDVDSAGNAYVTGGTGSDNFPTLNPLQASLVDRMGDAFVTKFTPNGSLIYSTYLGGGGTWSVDGYPGDDYGMEIVADSSGNAYVVGGTLSSNFPTVNPLQPTHGGGYVDVFVAKLNPTGSALVFSSYLGGSGQDWGYGIAADSSGNAYLTGYTASTDFPTANPLQPTYGGGGDAFVAKISAETSPPQAIQQLVNTVITLNLKAGIESSLDAKLQAAAQAINDLNQNNNVAAINSLQAFINSVQAQRGVQISSADADALIAAAQAIIAQLQGM